MLQIYKPTGFTLEYLIFKEFFDCNLASHNSMESFLNKIKQLNDELTSQKLGLPKAIVIS